MDIDRALETGEIPQIRDRDDLQQLHAELKDRISSGDDVFTRAAQLISSVWRLAPDWEALGLLSAAQDVVDETIAALRKAPVAAPLARARLFDAAKAAYDHLALRTRDAREQEQDLA